MGKTNNSTKEKKRGAKSSDQNFKWFYIILVLCVVIAFVGGLNCGFTNWDDQYYVTSNPVISSWSSDHLKEMFIGFTAGNYHPVTMLSLSLDYFLYEKNPAGYHFTNLLLHTLNTLLVFVLVNRLSGRRDISFLVALFFGIHPMHSESVLWISERKDLLYTFFILLSTIYYLKLPSAAGRYAIKKVSIFLLLFLLALLSKGQAVVLPLLLLLMDYYRGEIRIRSRWLEKIPMLLISFGFGLLAIKAQHLTEAMNTGEHLDILHRMVAAGYGIFTYTWKALLPINQSSLYLLPSSIPWAFQYYAGSVVALGILIITVFLRNKRRDWFFGFLFFIISLLPVLQLLPVGKAIIAERYSYLAYIGLFFALFSLIGNINPLRTSRIIVPVSICTIAFLMLTWNRCDVWNSSISLWTDAIEKDPECAIAYCNRGVAYSDSKQFDLAERDFLSAVGYDSLYKEAFNDLGLLYYNRKQFEKALLYYNRSINASPDYGEAHNNRGIVFAIQGKTQLALEDFSQAAKSVPGNANAWFNKGNALVEIGDTITGLQNMEKSASLYLEQENKQGYDHVEERMRNLRR